MTMVALEGLRPWLWQRLSAIYLLLYTLYFLVYWSLFGSIGFVSWKSWLLSDINQMLLGLFYISLLIHAWVGIRDVLLDYIKPLLLRLMLLFIVAGFLFACSIWMLKILLSVST